MDSPSLGLGQVATGIDPDTGSLQTTAGEDPMPVALFEPERAMMFRLPGGEPTEIQVEGAIAAGLRRFPRGFADLRTIPGWALHRLADDRIELRSPGGGDYSRITVPASPGWYSAALHHGYVVLLRTSTRSTYSSGKHSGAVQRRRAAERVPHRPGPRPGRRRHHRPPQQPLNDAVPGGSPAGAGEPSARSASPSGPSAIWNRCADRIARSTWFIAACCTSHSPEERRRACGCPAATAPSPITTSPITTSPSANVGHIVRLRQQGNCGPCTNI